MTVNPRFTERHFARALVALRGLDSNKEFAQRLGVSYFRVVDWLASRNLPTEGAVRMLMLDDATRTALLEARRRDYASAPKRWTPSPEAPQPLRGAPEALTDLIAAMELLLPLAREALAAQTPPVTA